MGQHLISIVGSKGYHRSFRYSEPLRELISSGKVDLQGRLPSMGLRAEHFELGKRAALLIMGILRYRGAPVLASKRGRLICCFEACMVGVAQTRQAASIIWRRVAWNSWAALQSTRLGTFHGAVAAARCLRHESRVALQELLASKSSLPPSMQIPGGLGLAF